MFEEYPKWIDTAEGRRIVESADEETAALAGDDGTVADSAAEPAKKPRKRK